MFVKKQLLKNLKTLKINNGLVQWNEIIDNWMNRLINWFTWKSKNCGMTYDFLHKMYIRRNTHF